MRSVIPKDVVEAFMLTKDVLGKDLEGACLEAAVIMADILDRAEVLRRESPKYGGHWTVRVRGVEYDPTICFWTAGAPADSKRGELYVVGPKSPHRAWPVTETSKDPLVWAHLRETIAEMGVDYVPDEWNGFNA